MFVPQEEIDKICFPLTQPAAQIRYLRKELHLTVGRKPNGQALVLQAHLDLVMGGKAAAPQKNADPEQEQEQKPDEGALILYFNKRGNGGAKAKKQSAKPA